MMNSIFDPCGSCGAVHVIGDYCPGSPGDRLDVLESAPRLVMVWKVERCGILSDPLPIGYYMSEQLAQDCVDADVYDGPGITDRIRTRVLVALDDEGNVYELATASGFKVER